MLALDEDFAIGGHAGLGESEAGFQLQLDADDLLDAVVAEVGVLRREGGLRIDARDVGVDRLLRGRVEIDARGLADFYLADLALRHESAQIDLGQVEQRDDGGPGGHDFARLGGARDDGPGERRADGEVVAIVLRLGELGAGLLRSARLRWRLRPAAAAIWRLHQRDLRLVNVGVGERRLRGGELGLRRLDAALRGGNRGGLLIGGGGGLQALALRDGAGFGEARVRVLVECGELIGGLLLREVGLRGGKIGLGLLDAALGVELRLAHLQLALVQLLLEDGDLLARGVALGLGRR